jgi:hypothetical protein
MLHLIGCTSSTRRLEKHMSPGITTTTKDPITLDKYQFMMDTLFSTSSYATRKYRQFYTEFPDLYTLNDHTGFIIYSSDALPYEAIFYGCVFESPGTWQNTVINVLGDTLSKGRYLAFSPVKWIMPDVVDKLASLRKMKIKVLRNTELVTARGEEVSYCKELFISPVVLTTSIVKSGFVREEFSEKYEIEIRLGRDNVNLFYFFKDGRDYFGGLAFFDSPF